MKNANLLKDLKTMFSSAFWLRWSIGVPITLIYFLLLYSIDFPTKNGLLAEKTAKIGPKYPKNGVFNLIFQVLKKKFSRFFVEIRKPHYFGINLSHKPTL